MGHVVHVYMSFLYKFLFLMSFVLLANRDEEREKLT